MKNIFTKSILSCSIGFLSLLASNDTKAQLPYTLTQNVNTNTFQMTAIGCWNTQLTAHNDQSYWRVYNLNNYASSFGGNSKVIIEKIEFGVLQTTSNVGNQKVVVNLYKLNNPTFIKANLTLLSTDTLTLAGLFAVKQIADGGVLVNPNETVVAEVRALSGIATNSMFMIGSNISGETGVSYFSSTQCGLIEPTPIQGLVSGVDMHLMIDLKGLAGNPPAQPDSFTNYLSSVCVGTNNVVYTVPAVSGATSYNWTYTGTGATITNNGNSASINFSMSATSGVLEVTATNQFGTSIARTFNINLGPSFTFSISPSNPSICEGDTITLTANYSSIYSIDWQPPTGLDAINTQSVKASPAQSHTYTATIVDSGGCVGSGTVFLEVRNNPVLTINPNKLVLCGDDSLAINVTGANTYVWTPNLYIDNAQASNVKVIPPATMNYLITGTGSNGCISEKMVNVEVRPELQPTVTQNGKVLSTQTGYQSYLWYKDGMPVIPTAFFHQFTVKSDGVYKVYVTDIEGCGGFSDEIHIKGLSISDIFRNSIKVYPNPTQAVLNIETNRIINIELQSIDGKMITSEKNTKIVDMSALPDGVYLLLITDVETKAQSIEKIVKSTK